MFASCCLTDCERILYTAHKMPLFNEKAMKRTLQNSQHVCDTFNSSYLFPCSLYILNEIYSESQETLNFNGRARGYKTQNINMNLCSEGSLARQFLDVYV
jgi:hypothetical protein